LFCAASLHNPGRNALSIAHGVVAMIGGERPALLVDPENHETQIVRAGRRDLGLLAIDSH
jgi:hypothetical protein